MDINAKSKSKAGVDSKTTGRLTGPKRRGYRGIEANGSGRERVVLTVILAVVQWDLGSRWRSPRGRVYPSYIVAVS